MSLLEEAYEDYIILNKVRVNDGYGGYVIRWEDGPEISGAMVMDTSTQAKVAMAQGVKAIYTFTTRKNITLDYHDAIKRVRDNKIFRVTSEDKATPNSAGLNMRQVTVEEWELED